MYSLGSAAPVNNPGFFDVPIHNMYSNPLRSEDESQPIDNYEFNNHVANTINETQNYLVRQNRNIPSPSLYYEQDKSMSGYQYPNDLNDYKLAAIEKNKFYKKEIPSPYESYQLENFTNGNEANNPVQQVNNQMQNSPKMPNNIPNIQPPNRPAINRDPPNRPLINDKIVSSNNEIKPTNRPIRQNRGRHKPHHSQQPKKVIYNNYIPQSRPDVNYYYDYIPRFVPNNYLNIGSIPNIAGFYSNFNNTPLENVVYREPVVETPVIDAQIDENINIEEKSLNDNEIKPKKKKAKKKRKSNLIYLVLFLLILVILMMLYIIFKNQKRVRF